MEITRKLLKCFIPMVFAVFTMTGCDDSSSDDEKITPETSEEITKTYLICAGRNPGGVGINLDSEESCNFDDNKDFDWDMKIKVYKGVDSSGKGGGRPYIALKGKGTVTAYSYGSGNTAYSNIEYGDVDTDSLTGDSISDVDASIVPTNASNWYIYDDGTADTNDLKEQYSKLVIGEKWKASASNTNHSDDAIYIIKSDEGGYFKVIVTDFGGSSDIGQNGYIKISYKKIIQE